MRTVKFLTLPETADRARTTQRPLLSHIAAGTGPTVTKIGRRTLIREDHFQQWLERNAHSGSEQAA